MQALDKFIHLADISTWVLGLKNKMYLEYELDNHEWQFISLMHHVLQVHICLPHHHPPLIAGTTRSLQMSRCLSPLSITHLWASQSRSLSSCRPDGRNYLMMKNLHRSTMGLKRDSRTLVSGTTSLMRWMYTSSALVSVMSPYVIFGNLITCSPRSDNETQIHQAPVGHDLP